MTTPTTAVECPYHDIPFVYCGKDGNRNLFECLRPNCHYLLSSPSSPVFQSEVLSLPTTQNHEQQQSPESPR